MALGRQKNVPKIYILRYLGVGVLVKHMIIMDLRLKILYQAVAAR
jgi:hypothetical protein